MAGGRGVEPHPVSENLVFKASRRTNPAALLSVYFYTFTVTFTSKTGLISLAISKYLTLE